MDCELDKANGKPMEIKRGEVSRFRELLRCILKVRPKVVLLTEYNEDGEAVFGIAMEDMGLTVADYVRYKPEIFSNYIVDTIGELIVRENIDVFANIITKLDAESYSSVVGQWEHKRFGMRIIKNMFIFKFHLSLLQNILTEDLKKKV